MEQWERSFENLSLYICFLMLLSAVVFLTESKLVWPVTLLLAVGFAFITNWIQKGPELQAIKGFMDQRGIRPIHLWIGITALYYGFVGLFYLLT